MKSTRTAPSEHRHSRAPTERTQPYRARCASPSRGSAPRRPRPSVTCVSDSRRRRRLGAGRGRPSAVRAAITTKGCAGRGVGAAAALGAAARCGPEVSAGPGGPGSLLGSERHPAARPRRTRKGGRRNRVATALSPPGEMAASRRSPAGSRTLRSPRVGGVGQRRPPRSARSPTGSAREPPGGSGNSQPSYSGRSGV